MKTIVVINHKGGVGKTFVSAGLAVVFAQRGKRVLLVDTDPQGNLSRMFGFDPKSNNEEKTLFYCLNNKLKNGGEKTSSYISNTEYENIDILAGDIQLTTNRIEVERALVEFNFVYKKIIKDISKECKYDFVIIDTPPSLGGENSQVLMAANYLLIPTTTGLNSIEGINTILEFYSNCKEINDDLELIGIVLNDVQSRSTVFRDVFPVIKENYGDALLDTRIESSAVAKKVEWNGMKPSKTKVFKAFENLYEEVVKRIGD